MTGAEFLTLAGSAGLLSAALMVVTSAISGWLARRRHARYLALRVAVQMDAYFHACIDLILPINEYDASGGHAGQQHFSIPSPPDLPNDDIGWISIHKKLSDRALSFGIRVEYMNKDIRNRLEHDCDQLEDRDTSYTLTYLYKTAQDAYILAQDLRDSYGLGKLEHSKKSYQWLLEAKAKHAKRVLDEEERVREARKQMLGKMPAISPKSNVCE